MKKLLIENLKELKSSFGASGVKAEFESEGATIQEVEILKNLADEAGLDFILKIGGCEARRDLDDAAKFGITHIVAPMIESEYAFEKFIKCAACSTKNVELFINIETMTGYNALDDILANELSGNLSGIVFGRSDFAASIHINDVEEGALLNLVKSVSQKTLKYNKKFILGGGISASSLEFINQIPYLTGFETRKIVFSNPKPDVKMIQKALEFEINWLEYKQSFSPADKDKTRLAVLLQRYCTI